MSAMIRMPGQDGPCAVDLLGEDEAGESMGHGHGAQRKQQARAAARFRRPSIGRANGEDQVLRAFVASRAQPGGESFRIQGAAAAVEQHGDGRRSSSLAREPGEQSFLAAERLRLAARVAGATLEIHLDQHIEMILAAVFGRVASADMSEGDLHSVVTLQASYPCSQALDDVSNGGLPPSSAAGGTFGAQIDSCNLRYHYGNSPAHGERRLCAEPA